MPIVSFDVYRTTIVNGVATQDSELTTITLNDADNNGAITREEWQAYLNATQGTANPFGHLGGTAPGEGPALWDGDGTGNFTDGTLYTSVPIVEDQDVSAILDDLIHNKYAVSIDDLNVCFLAGTMIATPTGDRAVETLRAGDLVLTRDNGPQPLIWVGHSLVDADRLDRNPNMRPVRIKAGALGEGLPRRGVSVSPQHRILVIDADGNEALASARHLQASGMRGLRIVKDHAPFTLVHIACADHQILQAEGAAMESFFPGPMALRALTDRDRDALFAALPALARGENPMTPARRFLKKKEVEALVQPQPMAAE